MTITAATADQLDALGLAIFNPNLAANEPPELGAHYDPALFTGIRGEDAATDAQLAELIAPVMLAIDGRTLATGFKYTMNVTNALQLRPKHWFMQGLYELDSTAIPPCCVTMLFFPTPGGHVGDAGAFGFTLGTTMCKAICHAWAAIIRLWLAGNYPLAVSQPVP